MYISRWLIAIVAFPNTLVSVLASSCVCWSYKVRPCPKNLCSSNCSSVIVCRSSVQLLLCRTWSILEVIWELPHWEVFTLSISKRVIALNSHLLGGKRRSILLVLESDEALAFLSSLYMNCLRGILKVKPFIRGWRRNEPRRTFIGYSLFRLVCYQSPKCCFLCLIHCLAQVLNHLLITLQCLRAFLQFQLEDLNCLISFFNIEFLLL